MANWKKSEPTEEKPDPQLHIVKHELTPAQVAALDDAERKGLPHVKAFCAALAGLSGDAAKEYADSIEAYHYNPHDEYRESTRNTKSGPVKGTYRETVNELKVKLPDFASPEAQAAYEKAQAKKGEKQTAEQVAAEVAAKKAAIAKLSEEVAALEGVEAAPAPQKALPAKKKGK